MVGSFPGLCARAASGHAAAPPSSVMNWRRFTQSPRRRAAGMTREALAVERLLDRQVGGLRPAQNLVDVVGGAPEHIREVWSVGHETPGLDIIPGIEDRRQSPGVRKRDDASAVEVNESIPHD